MADDPRHHEVTALAVTGTNSQPAVRQRKIGLFGTSARIAVGALLVGSVVQGHLARGFHLSAWVLGLVGFPALLVGLQWLRARRTPTRLEATGPVGHAVSLAVFLALIWPIDQLEHHRAGQRPGWAGLVGGSHACGTT